MRHISKRKDGGPHLNKAHENPPSDKDEAEARWKSYGYRKELQNFLLAEQYFLCCYSEVRADKMRFGYDDKEWEFGYHIEHVQPKSSYPTRTFDYQNLAASALHSNVLGKVSSVFGGHAKLGKYDPNLFISCHEDNCARFFEYLSDGRVVAARSLDAFDKGRAEYTIELLNLNSPVLLVERQAWWDELDNFRSYAVEIVSSS
ncbi:MAG: TIGR02646 family protein [Thiotrichaceae bacterium]|nr:TIGR02646 family protein [Thiotrichaceae bacterium]